MRCGFNVINRVIHLSTERGLCRRDLSKMDFSRLSLDMWKAYVSTSKEKFPNASIVHDRFHLAKYQILTFILSK